MGSKKIDLKELFYLRCKGFNNAEIARKLNVERESIQYHVHKFRKMFDLEFNKLLIKHFFEDLAEEIEEERK